ncbi:MAG TPA: alpha/beta fold hydrolase [Chloroflexota bacterium]|jgi:pimeloyl-ACP methyl ester carboxylesterase|nr:alpha/beta fold hydrolase [Chloroflexota bacterium]
MGARQVLALGSAALGALAALNSALSTPPPPAPPSYGVAGRFRWSEGDIQYTVSGSGPAVVLVHGIGLAASSLEMRYVVEPLARACRVYTLDLLGFGHSARPRIKYTAGIYVTLIEDFLREESGPGAVIASGLSGAYCLTIAARRPELIQRLILSSPPPIARAAPPGAARQTAGLLLDAPVVGQSMLNVLTARAGIRTYLREQAYYNRDLVTESMVDARYAMAHQPNARYAAQAYMAGRLDLDSSAALAALQQPLLLIFGAAAQPAAAASAAAYARLNPRAQILLLERCRLLPHEEQAERFVEAATAWLTPQTRR